MHKYFTTADNRIVAVRLTGQPSELFQRATQKLTLISAPRAAKAKRVLGLIPTLRVLDNGDLGSI